VTDNARTEVRVLHVEDSVEDAELVQREIQKSGIKATFHRVCDESDLRAALELPWDVVLSDYKMPRFDGLRAFELVRETQPRVPFIFVSGQIGEARAVRAMRAGARDFVAKANLSRLGAAMHRELDEVARRREASLHSAELVVERERYRALADGAPRELIEVERLDALASLCRVLTQDFAGLLQVAKHNAISLLDVDGLPESAQTDVYGIRDASTRAMRLIDSLREFAVPRDCTAQSRTDINPTVQTTAVSLQRLATAGVVVSIDLHPAPLLVSASPATIETILLNVMLNALDAIAGPGRIDVSTRVVHVEQPGPLCNRDRARPGSFAVLTVEDSGTGMDEATRLRVFEPLFTTKSTGRGSGLGLSTVFGAVTSLGGFLEVDSEPGRGTIVRTFLPRLD